MKKGLYILAAGVIAMLSACNSDIEESFYLDELVIDTENCYAEGSYVQGVAVSEQNRIRVPYEGAKGGSAVFSAPKENGISIPEQTLSLAEGEGEVLLSVEGTPLRYESTFLQLNIAYNGKKYLSSVEISVLEDQDPSGVIVFTMQDAAINSLTSEMTIPFTVSPTMASVSETSEQIDGLRVLVSTDQETGEGTVTLNPAENFLGGKLTLTASFGARQAQVKTIDLSAFASGDGSKAAPYEVGSAAEMGKIQYGLGSFFRLTGDIDVTSGWTPVGSAATPFTGGIDGGSHKVKIAINRPSEDYVAFVAYAGQGAEIKDLVLEGSVKGRNYVSAAVASSAQTLSGVDASAVSVEGENHVAALVAAGEGKDANVIEFSDVPQYVNIPMGAASYSEALGISTKGVTVSFEAGETGTEWSYDADKGEFTVTRLSTFKGGDVTFTVSLGDNVKATSRVLSVTSKNMYEGGSGTADDPYIVADADQFTATLHSYPASCVKLSSDIAITAWETIAEFSGTLDGGSHSVSGLSAPFAELLSGEVKNIKFKDINITAGTGNCGAIANKLSGKVSYVGVQGVLSAPTKAASGDTGLSPVAGQALGKAVIDNCYVNVETTIVGTNFAFGGLVGVIKETDNVTMSNSTVGGKVSSAQNITKVGGVLGRKTNKNQTSKDIITGCLVNMDIAITGTGSNMVGGIFGALQGATVAGDYVGGVTVEKSAFTGSVSAGNAVGGIGGVCCSVRDCYVGGSVQATSVASSSTAAAAGVSAAAKGDVTRCVVAGARVTGEPKGTSYTAGVINVKNGNAPKTTGCYVLNTVIQTSGFAIYGTASENITATDNYRWGVTYSTEPSVYVPLTTDTYGQDGTEKQMTQADLTALGYDFTSVWKWDSATSAPVLRSVGCADSVIIK